MRNSKGFTLVELAVVLVIIGIILGAVIKGQDLISNAKAKQVTATAQNWSSLAFAYIDRNGRLPGDGNKNGFIGDQTTAVDETTAALSASTELYSAMKSAPLNPVSVGGQSFYYYFGYATVGTTKTNVLIVCAAEDCNTAYTADDVEILKAFDSSIDGQTSGSTGNVRAVSAVTAPATDHTDTSKVKGVPTATIALAGGDWTAGTTKAAVWAFDRPF